MWEFIACLLIGKLKNPWEGTFDEGWEYNEHLAWNAKLQHSIWISNGLDFLRDENMSKRVENMKPFIQGANSIEKFLIWKAWERRGRKDFKLRNNL